MMAFIGKKNIRRISAALVFAGMVCILYPAQAFGASLSISPASKTLTVGSTFDVSLFLDTENTTVNAVGVSLSFPPDQLQIVSPSAGKSIVDVWTVLPKFNNQKGQVSFQGGISGGINVTNGLLTTMSFRVKAVGSAIVKFLDDSRVLLHDGLGTDALTNTRNGIFQLILPPPLGPDVVSETHPDQSSWYSGATVSVRWESPGEGVEGYSYILNKEPVGRPDDISEGKRETVTYGNLTDGSYYFHIKALRGGSWGGVTHFSVRIDTTPPAKFPVEISPSPRTTTGQSFIQFSSTDALSGIDRYELKVVPLQRAETLAPDEVLADQQLFIDVQSPYVSEPLPLGTYDVIVRAYDKAQNYREVTTHLSIVRNVFRVISEKGLEVNSTVVIPWIALWLSAGALIVALSYLGWRVRRWHGGIHAQISQGALPQAVLQQLEELKHYRAKYGKTLAILLAVLSMLFSFSAPAFAGEVQLAPPLVTMLSRNISNEEILYIGGITENPATTVVIYLQNSRTGETTSYEVVADRHGDWFYRHDTFLTADSYILWGQSKIEDGLSPPSPEVRVTVHPTAIQFGASRLSYTSLYFFVSVALLLIVIGLLSYIFFHAYHGRTKRALLMKEIEEAEQSVRRGFAVLRRDIQAELSLVHEAKLNRELSHEQKVREEQLLKDLAWAEQYIGKEIWDVELAEKTRGAL